MNKKEKEAQITHSVVQTINKPMNTMPTRSETRTIPPRGHRKAAPSTQLTPSYELDTESLEETKRRCNDAVYDKHSKTNVKTKKGMTKSSEITQEQESCSNLSSRV
jgi:hypothetical protein